MTTDDWRIYVEEAESEGKMAITAQVTDTRTNQVYSASKMNIMTYLLDTFLRRHRLGLTSIFDFSSATDVDRFIARMQRYGDHEPWIDELSVLLDSIILHEVSDGFDPNDNDEG
jgi:hypothetical protein